MTAGVSNYKMYMWDVGCIYNHVPTIGILSFYNICNAIIVCMVCHLVKYTCWMSSIIISEGVMCSWIFGYVLAQIAHMWEWQTKV